MYSRHVQSAYYPAPHVTQTTTEERWVLREGQPRYSSYYPSATHAVTRSPQYLPYSRVASNISSDGLRTRYSIPSETQVHIPARMPSISNYTYNASPIYRQLVIPRESCSTVTHHPQNAQYISRYPQHTQHIRIAEQSPHPSLQETAVRLPQPARKIDSVEDLRAPCPKELADLLNEFLEDFLNQAPQETLTDDVVIPALRKWAIHKQIELIDASTKTGSEGQKEGGGKENDGQQGPAQILAGIADGIFAKENAGNVVKWLSDYLGNLKEEACVGIAVDNQLAKTGIDEYAPASLPTAFVLDCGTGETKVLLYTYDGAISIQQIALLGPAGDYLDEPEKFVALVGVYFKKHNASTAMVAASAWLRNASGPTLEKANKMMQEMMKSGIVCKVLEQNYEGWMEAVAVDYAGKKLNLPFDCFWASGGGSTQFCFGFEEIAALPLGSREGISIISEQGPAKGAEIWADKVRKAIEELRTQMTTKLTGLVCAMSGVYFASKSCQIPTEKKLSVAEVRAAFQATIDSLVVQPGLDKTGKQSLSNVILQSIFLDEMVDPTATIYFMRDMKVDGKDFRITWSCGWYINLLSQVGALDATGMKSIQHLQRTMEPSQLLQEIPQKQKVAAAHTLCGLKKVVDVMMSRASDAEKVVTPLLQEICDKTFCKDARLEGLDYRFKSKESLSRKLRTKLGSCLEAHKYEPFYIPKLADVIKNVDDILRYTIVSKQDRYADVVCACRDRLKKLDKVGEEGVQYENYWMEHNTFYGVTFWVTRDGFTFELQIHTEYSWEVKQKTSHELYEIFRLLQPSDAKLLLHQTMKDVWDPNHIPKGLDKVGNYHPYVDTLMEQLHKVREYEKLFLQRLEEMQEDRQQEGIISLRSSPSGALRRCCHPYFKGFEGLCGRLIRGKHSSEFEWMAMMDDSKSGKAVDGSLAGDKRLAWFGSHQLLEVFLEYKPERLPQLVAQNMGKPLNWVEDKMHQGFRWRMLVLPQKFCKKADWDGLLEVVIVQFPEVAPIIARFAKALKETPFEEMQKAAGETFRSIKNKGTSYHKYMNIESLRNVHNVQLWHVRGFFYNVIGANELYRGDGNVYDENGQVHGAEFVCANQRIADARCATLLPYFQHPKGLDN